MRLIGNFKIKVDDEKSEVEFGIEEAEGVKADVLLALSKCFSDVEKKVNSVILKFKASPPTSVEKETATSDIEIPLWRGDESDEVSVGEQVESMEKGGVQ